MIIFDTGRQHELNSSTNRHPTDSILSWAVVPDFVEFFQVGGESLQEVLFVGLALRYVHYLTLLTDEAMHVHSARFALSEKVVEYAVF